MQINARITAMLALGLVLAACSRNSDVDLLASGRDLAAKHDLRGATIQLKSALQKNPDSAEARYLLGKVLLESGDAAAAAIELRKALELQHPDELVAPDLARAMLRTGESSAVIAQFEQLNPKDPGAAADLKTSVATAAATQRDFDKANLLIDEALRIKPGFPAALLVRARLLVAGGDLDGGLEKVSAVLKADPANEGAGMLKGDLLLQGRGDVPAALAAYQDVLKAKPDSVAAHSAIADLLMKQGKVDEARAEVDALKKIAPRHPETLILDAQLAFQTKDYARSRQLTDQLLKPMPDNVRVLELAGFAEYRLKNYLQAEAFLAKALKLAPRQVGTRQVLAQTYLRSGQPERTLEVLAPMLEGGKADAAVLSLLGETYLQLGDARKSEEAFARAIKAAPQDSRVRTNAALAQMARGNTAAAAGDLEAIAAGDSGPRADLALVSARLRQGDIPAALKAVDGLEKKLPDQPLAPFLRGRLLLMKKDNAGATKAYEAALARDASYFPAVAALAAMELADDKPDAARKRFESHLAAQPKSWQARLALAELEQRTGAPAPKVTAMLREAVKANPGEARSQLALVNQLIATGDAKAALLAAQEATAALPNRFEVVEARGRAELAAGDQQRAISTFKQLGSMQPRNPASELRLADAYFASKDTESARRSLQRASDLAPDLFAPRRSLAMLAVQEGKFDDALRIAREAQKRQPKDPQAFVLEGDIESARKNWDGAIGALRNAQQRAPASGDVAVRLHAALAAGGKGAEADRMAADWVKAHPKDAAFLYYLGDQALMRNDLPAAEGRYRAVLEVQPANALAMNNVAWLLSKQGKPGALAMAEKANQLMPDRAPLLDTLSIVQEAENQLPKAIDTQKRAIALAPSDGTLVLRLAKLYIKTGDKDRARAELESLAKLGDKFAGQAEVATLLKTL